MTFSHITFNLGKFSGKVSRWKIVKIVSSENFSFRQIVFDHLLLRCFLDEKDVTMVERENRFKKTALVKLKNRRTTVSIGELLLMQGNAQETL